MSRDVEHSLNGPDGFLLYSLIDEDFGKLEFQAIVEFLHRVEAHKVAFVAGAGAVLRRRGDKLLAGALFAHLVDDTALGGDDEALFVRLDGVLQQGCGRADEIRDLDDGLFALRMGDDLRVGILFLQFYNLFEGELLVDVAGTVPEKHFAARDAVDVVAEVAVRTENDFRVFR